MMYIVLHERGSKGKENIYIPELLSPLDEELLSSSSEILDKALLLLLFRLELV